MKPKTFAGILAVCSIAFSGCKKQQFLDFGNQINLVNPFETFRQDHPDWTPFPELHMNFSAGTMESRDSEFLIVGGDGSEYSLKRFNSNSVSGDQRISKPIDWHSLIAYVNPNRKLLFKARISYLTEDAYEVGTDPLSGEPTEYLVENYFDFIEYYEVEMETRIEPNRIYEMDMIAQTLEDLGVYLVEPEELAEDLIEDSGSLNCDMNDYAGPIFNIQIHSQCQTAFLYDCFGYYDAAQVACQFYYDWDDGSGTLPDCPYCD